MPKQCPDCHTIASNDMGYCPACERPLVAIPATSNLRGFLQFLAVMAVSGGAALGLLYFLQAHNG